MSSGRESGRVGRRAGKRERGAVCWVGGWGFGFEARVLVLDGGFGGEGEGEGERGRLGLGRSRKEVRVVNAVGCMTRRGGDLGSEGSLDSGRGRLRPSRRGSVFWVACQAV